MHRCPLGIKYLLLMLIGAGPLVMRNVVISGLAVLVAGAFVVLGAKMDITELVIGPGFLVANGLIVAYQAIFHDWREGVTFICGMLALLWLCRILTTTTSVAQLMDGIAACAKPFRFLGAKPEQLALTVSIMWSSIPYLLVSIRNVRDAARARGIRPSWRFLSPVLIAAVGHALAIGEALQARGLSD